MDSAELLPETAVSHPAPQFHIAPRHFTPEDDAPTFFAQFDTTGRILELLTPTTREHYCAQVAAADGPRGRVSSPTARLRQSCALR